jgi:hypothetical protein
LNQSEAKADAFVEAAAAVPESIGDTSGPYTAGPAIGAGEVMPPEGTPEPLFKPEYLQGALESVFALIGEMLSRGLKDECYRLTPSETKSLASSWTPLGMYYLAMLPSEEAKMWAVPVMVTAAIFGGKATQAQLKKASTGKAKSSESAPSSGGAAPEKQPSPVTSPPVPDV